MPYSKPSKPQIKLRRYFDRAVWLRDYTSREYYHAYWLFGLELCMMNADAKRKKQ